MKKNKIIIGIVVLVLLVVVLSSIFSNTDEETEKSYKAQIEQLQKDNEQLTKKIVTLSTEVVTYRKVADTLKQRIDSKEKEIAGIKRKKDEKVNGITNYDVDALYEYFSKFNTSSNGEE